MKKHRGHKKLTVVGPHLGAKHKAAKHVKHRKTAKRKRA